MANNTEHARKQHWEKTRNLTFIVLALWVVFALIVPFSASSLNNMSFLGFPLGYYMCVQGSLIAFVIMIWVQNWRQDQIDEEFGIEE